MIFDMEHDADAMTNRFKEILKIGKILQIERNYTPQ